MLLLLTCFVLSPVASGQVKGGEPYVQLLEHSWARTSQHGGSHKPVLSPGYEELLNGVVPVDALHKMGFKTVGGTTHDLEILKTVIGMGVDGMITDRPEVLHGLLREEIANSKTAKERERLATFDVQAHRGGRGLRPESTLPSFENGMDMLVTTLELDTGVTKDHVSLIWHDEFFNPTACRRSDATGYSGKDKAWIWDMTVAEAQKHFICDKLYFETAQKNDHALSPVAVAFATHEHLADPYTPITLDQLFRFVKFYGEYYSSGAGRSSPVAKQRAHEAERVRFNVETKLIPNMLPSKGQPEGKLEPTTNHTAEPQDFVTAACGTVKRNHMDARVEIQSFDFRTLKLVEEQFSNLPTYYLTGNERTFPYQVAHLE